MEKNLYEFVEKSGQSLLDLNLTEEQKQMIQSALVVILKESAGKIDKGEMAVTIASEGVNFIPFIGSVKMIGEAMVGSKADGHSMEKNVRLAHLADDVLSLGLDVATGGLGKTVRGGAAVFKLGKKLQRAGKYVKLGKKLQRTGAFYRKNAKLLTEVAKYTRLSRTGVRLEKKRLTVVNTKNRVLETMYATEQELHAMQDSIGTSGGSI